VKLAEGERATLQHEIDGYRAEAQEQQKARGANNRANTLPAPAVEACHATARGFGHQKAVSKLIPVTTSKRCHKCCLCRAQAIQQLEQERDRYASNAARANAAHAAAVADSEAKAVSSQQLRLNVLQPGSTNDTSTLRSPPLRWHPVFRLADRDDGPNSMRRSGQRMAVGCTQP